MYCGNNVCLPVQDGYGFLSLWQKTYIRSSVVRVSWPRNALDAVEHSVNTFGATRTVHLQLCMKWNNDIKISVEMSFCL